MKHHIFIWPFLTALLFVGPMPAAGQDLDEVLARVAVLQERFDREVRDLTMVQQSVIRTEAGRTRGRLTTILKGNLLRLESAPVPLEAVEAKTALVIVSNGRRAFVITPRDRRELSPEEVAQMRAGPFWWAVLAKGGRVTGREAEADRDCLVIDAPPAKNGLIQRFWVDASTLAAVKLEVRDPDGRKALLVFDDFQPVIPGVEMPHHVRTETEQGPAVEQTVISLTVNTGVEDTLFDPDAVRFD